MLVIHLKEGQEVTLKYTDVKNCSANRWELLTLPHWVLLKCPCARHWAPACTRKASWCLKKSASYGRLCVPKWLVEVWWYRFYGDQGNKLFYLYIWVTEQILWGQKWSLKWRYFLLLHNSDLVLSLYIWTSVCGVSVPCGFHGYVDQQWSLLQICYVHNNPPLLFQGFVLGHLDIKTLLHNVSSVHCKKEVKETGSPLLPSRLKEDSCHYVVRSVSICLLMKLLVEIWLLHIV